MHWVQPGLCLCATLLAESLSPVMLASVKLWFGETVSLGLCEPSVRVGPGLASELGV